MFAPPAQYIQRSRQGNMRYVLCRDMDLRNVNAVVKHCLVLLAMVIGGTTGDTRCYCNEPSCVQTGYMCKTETGHCYSRIPVTGTSRRSIHGCTDTTGATTESIKACEDAGNYLRSDGKEINVKHLWQCCQDDMCNYIDSASTKALVKKWNDSVNTKALLESWNQTGDALKSSQKKQESRKIPVKSKDIDKELWFKAAVIAVPLAGGFILVLLVLLAMRLLKHDTNMVDKLKVTSQPVESQRHKTKSFINRHFSSKKHIVPVHTQKAQSTHASNDNRVCDTTPPKHIKQIEVFSDDYRNTVSSSIFAGSRKHKDISLV